MRKLFIVAILSQSDEETHALYMHRACCARVHETGGPIAGRPGIWEAAPRP